MLQRRRFFSNNKKDPKEDYTFVDGIEARVTAKSGSYITLPIVWSDDLVLEMTVTTPASIGTTSNICNLFGSTVPRSFEGPKVTLTGKRPPYQKTISFTYNGNTYGEQNDNIPENLTKTVVKLDNHSLTIGSYVYTFNETSFVENDAYIKIFGSDGSAFQQGIIHNVKITTNSQIYNLVPCYYKKETKVGLLYDEVRNEVYRSSDSNFEFIPFEEKL